MTAFLDYSIPYDYNYAYGIYQNEGVYMDNTLNYIGIMLKRENASAMSEKFTQHEKAIRKGAAQLENNYQEFPAKINSKLSTTQPKSGGRMFRVKPTYKSKY